MDFLLNELQVYFNQKESLTSQKCLSEWKTLFQVTNLVDPKMVNLLYSYKALIDIVS